MLEFFKRRKSSKESEDKIASLPADDAILKTYQEQAQEGLQYLIDFMTDHEEGDELFRYAVKTNFIEGEHAEHMWVQVTQFGDDHFTGRLANEPNTIKLIKYGDTVKVHRKDIEDWILEDFLTRTKVGGFSSNYLRDKAK
ncbi:MAG: DUF2314 domain-containing protein [Bacteroidota bacterium]